MLSTAIIVLSVLKLCSTGNVTGQIFTKHDDLDQLMPTTGYMFELSTSRSLSDCGSTCLMTSNCTTFFYDSSDGRCQVHDLLPVSNATMVAAPRAKCYSLQVAQVCPVDYWSYNNAEICYYAMSDEPRNFENAKIACQQIGGRIAKIDTLEQNAVIKSMLEKSPSGSYYIGLNDISEETVFRWSDTYTSVIAYDDWGPGNPSASSENCVVMYQPDLWRWHTTDCVNTNFVVCQI